MNILFLQLLNGYRPYFSFYLRRRVQYALAVVFHVILVKGIAEQCMRRAKIRSQNTDVILLVAVITQAPRWISQKRGRLDENGPGAKR
jgi:hypothetical protein